MCIYTHVCVVLTVYHDLNVCYYGGPMLNKRNTDQNKFYHIKQRLLQFFTDVNNDLIMKTNVPLHPNSSYYQMCISKIQKSGIIIINIMRQPKPVS